MCTALSLVAAGVPAESHYFGRTLDLDRSYGEQVCVLPRRYPLDFRRVGRMDRHYAMVGMAAVAGGTPLYYDGVNEHGLCMAGLNFPGNAYYPPEVAGRDNVAPFEFIPWVLCQCKTVAEARALLGRLNLADIAFSAQLPPAPLHWMLCDGREAVVIEPVRDGLHIHDDPAGVMTNNPPFPYQLENLERYRHLRIDNQGVEREDDLPYEAFCQGLGAVGLPGDVSSMSRFVRAAFGREHSVCEADEISAVGQVFHLMASVEMVRGLCRTDGGTWDITGYTACMSGATGRYYYTTYGNRRISCVDMHKTDLEGERVSRFALAEKENIYYHN